MEIADSVLVEMVERRDGGLLVIELKNALQARFVDTTWEQREEVIASALLRRILVLTPTGHIQRARTSVRP